MPRLVGPSCKWKLLKTISKELTGLGRTRNKQGVNYLQKQRLLRDPQTIVLLALYQYQRPDKILDGPPIRQSTSKKKGLHLETGNKGYKDAMVSMNDMIRGDMMYQRATKADFQLSVYYLATLSTNSPRVALHSDSTRKWGAMVYSSLCMFLNIT